MRQPLNIAILGKDFHLSGGAEFLRILKNAFLSMSNDHQLKVFLLLPVRNKIDTFADLLMFIRKTTGKFIRQRKFSLPVRESVFDTNFYDYLKNIDGNVEIIEYNDGIGLVPALQKIETDVIIPAGNSLGKSFPFPWVGYVYDFQHKYYPDYFSSGECLQRDVHIATMLRDARAIVVNSESVKDDIYKFYPYSNCKVFNLPFSASPVLSWLKEDGPDIVEKYGLPSQYFLISNQFWIHKSHNTAFQALAILLNNQNLTDLHIVCTGKMEDYRFPDHIQNLKGEVSKLGITKNVHFLGHIPKVDQIAIMKKSMAVLQPTLFEGGPGGGSVYDAIALGIPAILSDIPVNNEIEGEENLFYFKAGSANDLADKIRIFLNQEIKRPTKEVLIVRGEKRKKMFGECLLEAINYVRNS